MKIVSSFKNLEHTDSLDQKIHEKSQKLQKYFEGNFEVQWTCFVREDGAHCADVKLIGPSFEYHASGHADSLYKTFDLVISKLVRQVQKKKEKWKAHINHKHSPSVKEVLLQEQKKDEEYWENYFEDDLAS